MSTASGSSSRHKFWTYCLLCCWLGCQLCSGGLKGCIVLCSLSWTFWCILWCCMGKLSLLNSGVEQWGWMVECFGCSACFEHSYGADLGTNELVSSCWLFQYLAHFSMTNGSSLNGGAERSYILAVLHVLNIHMELILVPMNSSHHANCFDTWLIVLWPMVLFGTGFLYRAVRGLWMGL